MASIENRSRFRVTVQNRTDLNCTFAHNATPAVAAYVKKLKAQGFKPKLSRLDNLFALRVRRVGYPNQTLFFKTAQEAIEKQQLIEAQYHQGLFVDYGKARRFTFADLLVRYVREESPRHKGFEVEGYFINAVLADAGLERVDLAAAYAEHTKPHESLAGKKLRSATGKTARKRIAASRFILKRFCDLMPEDFRAYADERCKVVAVATVDREMDIFSAVCRMAINCWRIPMKQSPMNGFKRDSYCNERDRRLKDDEEQRLLEAARQEDVKRSVALRLEELMNAERTAANSAATTYRRKAIIQEAREQYAAQAQATHVHVPLLEVFLQFQLMTGARLSEALSMTWERLDFTQQTALIPESKNGRPRKLALRKDLIALLQSLPRTHAQVFPVTPDGLRKAWRRIREAAGLVGKDLLHIHDLRHEAISRAAEAGANLLGGFALVDLQAFAGHRDTRMLLRYTHLSMPNLAKRLDMAFDDQKQVGLHHGRLRLKKNASVTMGDITDAALAQRQAVLDARAACDEQALPDELPSNVFLFKRAG